MVHFATGWFSQFRKSCLITSRYKLLRSIEAFVNEGEETNDFDHCFVQSRGLVVAWENERESVECANSIK